MGPIALRHYSKPKSVPRPTWGYFPARLSGCPGCIRRCKRCENHVLSWPFSWRLHLLRSRGRSCTLLGVTQMIVFSSTKQGRSEPVVCTEAACELHLKISIGFFALLNLNMLLLLLLLLMGILPPCFCFHATPRGGRYELGHGSSHRAPGTSAPCSFRGSHCRRRSRSGSPVTTTRNQTADQNTTGGADSLPRRSLGRRCRRRRCFRCPHRFRRRPGLRLLPPAACFGGMEQRHRVRLLAAAAAAAA